jgi:hypothetical protein
MNEEFKEDLIEKLESKQKDCIAFSKKYQSREMEDLKQYYEGANWALKFALSLIKQSK